MSVESHAGAGLLGVFGGTFNPIHLGHLRAAEQVVEILGLDRMLFVPAADPPHKREEALAPAELRLAWVRRAVAGNKRFEVDPLELERRGPSFSVDTLREIGARVAPERPVFVVGSDALAEMGSWREPETIVELAHLAVMARPSPAPSGESAAGAPGPLLRRFPAALAAAFSFDPGGSSARHRRAGTWARFVAIEPLDISATDVRARLRAGRSVRYLVPESIHEAVVESRVYAEGGAV
jgi:nicotinate-nucleotide adenylyltransferase